MTSAKDLKNHHERGIKRSITIFGLKTGQNECEQLTRLSRINQTIKNLRLTKNIFNSLSWNTKLILHGYKNIVLLSFTKINI